MKRTFEKIKLNQFSVAELEQRKLNALKGGCQCATMCNEICGMLCGTSNGTSSDVSSHAFKLAMATDTYVY